MSSESRAREFQAVSWRWLLSGKGGVYSHNCPLVYTEIQTKKKNYNSYCPKWGF